jgi:hypothetical protein
MRLLGWAAARASVQWFVGSRHVLRRNGERSAFSQLNQYAKPLKALADFRYARATTLNVDLIMTERSHGNEHFMTADYMTAELGARRSGSRCASIIPAKLPAARRAPRKSVQRCTRHAARLSRRLPRGRLRADLKLSASTRQFAPPSTNLRFSPKSGPWL